MDRDRYELRDLDLTEAERRALQVAVAAARTTEAEFGMFKLGGVADSSASITANLPQLELLPALREAIAARATVDVQLPRRAPRTLQPYALLLREGFWYVIGHDLGHDEVRTYRVDRIEGAIEQGDRDAFERPADFDPRAVFPADPKEFGEARSGGDRSHRQRPGDVCGSRAGRRVGRCAGCHDGGVEVEVPCSNLDAFRSWLFGWGVHAEVVGPAEVRAGLVEWLRGDGEPNVTRRRGPRRSGERLRRLLVMLPWLMERGEVPVAEMAARFELTEAELVGDLELAALCGLPPFIDEMIDVFIDEGVVFAGVPRLFTRPLRLTAPEGFALLSSGRAAMQLPGADPDGALARALDKLAGSARRRRRRRRRAAATGDRRRWPPRSTTTPGCACAIGRPIATRRPSGRSRRDRSSSTAAIGT